MLHEQRPAFLRRERGQLNLAATRDLDQVGSLAGDQDCARDAGRPIRFDGVPVLHIVVNQEPWAVWQAVANTESAVTTHW